MEAEKAMEAAKADENGEEYDQIALRWGAIEEPGQSPAALPPPPRWASGLLLLLLLLLLLAACFCPQSSHGRVVCASVHVLSKCVPSCC